MLYAAVIAHSCLNCFRVRHEWVIQTHSLCTYDYLSMPSIHLMATRDLLDHLFLIHYGDIVMGTVASQITSLTIVYSTIYSGADQRNHQSFALLAYVWGIHRGPVNSPHNWPVTRKMFPFDDVIMTYWFRIGYGYVVVLFNVGCMRLLIHGWIQRQFS